MPSLTDLYQAQLNEKFRALGQRPYSFSSYRFISNYQQRCYRYYKYIGFNSAIVEGRNKRRLG